MQVRFGSFLTLVTIAHLGLPEVYYLRAVLFVLGRRFLVPLRLEGPFLYSSSISSANLICPGSTGAAGLRIFHTSSDNSAADCTGSSGSVAVSVSSVLSDGKSKLATASTTS